ncbi:hypothetical protein [Mycobacterium sp. RTGN5]|uniref:hypothetical protein n=1 Tax=Mycobacterium sp. RTGN5 TaxID=3016522 RepID=UPI0029C71514|nr:hypothetical protein [Mycobacterium sp. RTGN5]
MTTLSPPPVRENILQFAEAAEPDPPSGWRRLIPRSRRGKRAAAAGLVVVLVAGVLGATYETSPGGTLWGAEKAIFPEHSQDVALAAVVNDLKQAQDILGSGQQPTPDQLTGARTSLNHAKQDLDYLSPSPEQASLQNLYLQLTQELLQNTPDSVQQLPALPAPPPVADLGDPSQLPDVALTSATAPSWGYPISDESGTVGPDDFVPPPPGVPDAPLGDWPQPYAPPLTPNLQDLGYFDPSWGQLYGYNPGNWYNYDLSGYNQYGYDFLGFDRWGYDRWGYDRWGYDHRGYNWGGYNWAGYDRNGWDRDGRNDWGQRRDHLGDPRDQNWYNGHHPYEQYYQWKFQNNDPVYHRTQWDQAHGFNPNQYQNWNMNRDWHNPRNRDWAPLPTSKSITDVDVRASSPVVNLNASLTQFISTDKVTNSGPSVKDLASKSTRDFTRELAPRVTIPTGLQPVSPAMQRLATPAPGHQPSMAPPALTAPAPAAPPSKVSPGFTAPKLSPVPAYTPPKVGQPQGRSEPAPANTTPGRGPNPSSGRTAIPPKADSPNPAAAPPADPIPATLPAPVVAPAPEDSTPHQANQVPRAPELRDRTTTPAQEKPPQQRAAPQQPAQEAPAPQAPVRQAPVHQAPAPRAPEQPAREAPPAHEAPAPAPRPAPEQHSAPAPPASKCSMPMCR